MRPVKASKFPKDINFMFIISFQPFFVESADLNITGRKS